MVHSLGRLKAWPAVLRRLRALPAFFAAIIPIHLRAAEIRGVVMDALGGEPLARVRIDLLNTELRTATDPRGNFTFASVPAGNYTLHVETVGYRLLNREFALAQDEAELSRCADHASRDASGVLFRGLEPLYEIGVEFSGLKI